MALLGTESIRQTGDSPKKGDSSVKSDVEDEPAKKNVPGWCADRDDIEVI